MSIVVREFRSAQAMLDVCWRWPACQDGQVPWVFRGQADADWPLLPTAFRDETWSRWGLVLRTLAPSGPDGDRDRGALQVAFEREVLRRFVDTTMESGQIQQLLRHPVTLDAALQDPWPSPALLPLLQSAYHHGVPTRLLHWTPSSWTALHFAARSAIDTSPPPVRFSVWAMQLPTSTATNVVVYDHEPIGAEAANERHGSYLVCDHAPLVQQLPRPRTSWGMEADGSLGNLCQLTLPTACATEVLDFLEEHDVGTHRLGSIDRAS